jgi:hypothetical protein
MVISVKMKDPPLPPRVIQVLGEEVGISSWSLAPIVGQAIITVGEV